MKRTADYLTVSTKLKDSLHQPKRRRMERVADSSQPADQKKRLKYLFYELRYLKSVDLRSPKDISRNSTPMADFTPVFLSHARVYVFAEQYDIQSLKRVALHTLCSTLKTFEVFPECVSDLVELIRFVYENTLQPEKEAEPMRNMLMSFIGWQMDKLVEADEFQSLLSENTEIMVDFCSVVAGRTKETPDEDS